MVTPDNSRSQPDGAESHFNGHSLVLKIRVVDPKMFLQKSRSSSY
jgi:hypothetical protein